MKTRVKGKNGLFYPQVKVLGIFWSNLCDGEWLAATVRFSTLNQAEYFLKTANY